MTMQHSSKSEQTCMNCGDTILKSEKRRTDGGLHKHFTCPKKKTKPTDGVWLLVA